MRKKQFLFLLLECKITTRKSYNSKMILDVCVCRQHNFVFLNFPSRTSCLEGIFVSIRLGIKETLFYLVNVKAIVNERYKITISYWHIYISTFTNDFLYKQSITIILNKKLNKLCAKGFFFYQST